MSAKRAAAPKSSGLGATKQTNKPTHAPALAVRSKQSGTASAQTPPAKVSSRAVVQGAKASTPARSLASKAPAKPAAKTPAKPVAKAPAKPAAKVPAKPAAKVPAKPAAKVPAKPAAKVPAKPVAKAPAKPAAKAPSKPVAKVPAKPVAKVPAKPVAKAPAKPVAKAPAKPVAKAPAKPVAKAPAKPAAKAPAKPAAKAPAKPVAKAPVDQVATTKAAARASKAPASTPKAPASTPLPAIAAESKSTARKVTQAVAAEATSASLRQRTPTTRAPRARPARADKAPAPAAVTTGKDKLMEDTAKPAARAVVRIARGLRTPKNAAAAPAKDDPTVLRREGPPPITRRSGAKIEINPRLERSKHLVTSTAPADGTAPKTMSVAAKHRAAAEAVFARLTVAEAKPAEVEAAAAPLPFSARPPDQGGGSFTMRVNEHDSAVTALRLAGDRDETLAAARNLAERFKLPPDQSLLLRVVALGDAALTKLALEELLELEDRGRVRPSAELKTVLGGLVTQDPETREIKQLLLEKIGVTS
jgi:hypothetical protein